MDISSEFVRQRLHYCLRLFLHASEEGNRQLEAVSTSRTVEQSLTDTFSKLAAIDLFGVVLALSGSSLLVVSISHVLWSLLTALARADLGWW